MVSSCTNSLPFGQAIIVHKTPLVVRTQTHHVGTDRIRLVPLEQIAFGHQLLKHRFDRTIVGTFQGKVRSTGEVNFGSTTGGAQGRRG